MPAPNEARRDRLCDAAITLIAREGAHGLTHRSVDREAGVPTGTTSNYFGSRDLLFAAAADRVGRLHREDMSTAEQRRGRSLPRSIAESLLSAATVGRDRYIAIFELQAEALRRPAVAESLAELQQVMADFTAEHHQRLGEPMTPLQRRLLMRLYGAALHSFVMQPAGTVERAEVNRVAAAIVAGVRAT